MSRTPGFPIPLLVLALSAVLPGCDGLTQHTVQEHIQRAKDFEDQGNLRGSIVELKNAVQKSPDHAQARLLLGQVYLKSGKGPEAEKELRLAEKYGVDREAIKPLLGEALLLAGEYQKVLKEVEPSEKTSPRNLARIQHFRAEAMFNMGNVPDACALFRKSHGLDAGNPEAHWGLARCALAENDPVEARNWLDTALRTGRLQARTWVYIGNLEQQAGRPESAVSAYAHALKLDPEQIQALQYRAALYLSMGRIDAARQDIARVAKRQPGSSTSRYLEALLDFEEKRYDAARDKTQQVLKNFPDYLPAILLAGSSAYALGSYEQAETYLKRYQANFPRHRYATRMLAATQIKRGQPRAGLQTLAPLLAADTDDIQTLVLAAEALRMSGAAEKSSEYLQRAAALAPKNSAIQTELGLSLLSSGNRQDALLELGKAAASDPGQYRADLLLIATLLDWKEYDRAIAAIRSASTKLPNHPLLATMLGSALQGKGDLAGGRAQFEKALSLDPVFFPAAAMLAQLDLADKNPGNARRRFERILEKDASHLQAMLALAELSAREKKENDYVGWLEKAAKAHPHAIAPRAILVRRHLARNEIQRALTIANETVAANPDDPAALDLLGSAQMAGRDARGALNTYNKLAQQANPSADTLLRLAQAQISAGRPAEARATLDKALKLAPGHAHSLDTLVRLEMREGRVDQALDAARRIQSHHPKLPLGFEREGDVLLAQKRPDLAARAFEQALGLERRTTYVIKLHRALTLAGKKPQADQILNDWIARAPDDLQARGYLAESLLSQGRSREAATTYEAILRHAPDNIVALNNLASAYLAAGDKRARATAEKALERAPDNPVFQDTLGWILLEQGHTARGLDLLGQALARLPRHPDVRYHHAVALARSGDKARARQEFESLLRDAPPPPRAEVIRRQLQALQP